MKSNSTINASKTFIIPVEIQNREFVAKLNLAVLAAERGFTVIIGDQKQIRSNLHLISPGYYLDKSSAKTKRDHFKRLSNMGFKIVALCEEGFVYRSTDKYVKERIDIESFNLLDKFFCWGKKQEKDLASHGLKIDKLVVTGNPRMDLLFKQFRKIWSLDVKKLKNEYGQYILFNTNFSRYNRLGDVPPVLELLRMRGTIGAHDDESYYNGLIEHLRLLMNHFCDAIDALATCFPNYTILIRPHPSENISSYDFLVKKHNNIKINQDGNIIPVLIGADLVVHNSCTTGVESYLLGKKVVAYVPIVNNEFDSVLPNSLGYYAKNIQELSIIVENSNLSDVSSSLLSDYLYFDEKELSCIKILNECTKTDFDLSIKQIIYRKMICLYLILAIFIKQLFRKETDLMKRKFPGVSLLDVTQIAHSLCEVQAIDAHGKLLIQSFNSIKNVFVVRKR